MALKETLDAMREASAKRVPAEKRAIMSRATADLRSSPQMSRVLKVGDKMPAFTATAHDGRAIVSGDMLSRGALVMSFFRGHW